MLWRQVWLAADWLKGLRVGIGAVEPGCAPTASPAHLPPFAMRRSPSPTPSSTASISSWARQSRSPRPAPGPGAQMATRTCCPRCWGQWEAAPPPCCCQAAETEHCIAPPLPWAPGSPHGRSAPCCTYPASMYHRSHLCSYILLRCPGLPDEPSSALHPLLFSVMVFACMVRTTALYTFRVDARRVSYRMIDQSNARGMQGNGKVQQA